MGKIATNYNEQIKILKSRGMILDLEESKIKEILLDIGYYRLGFYWHPFEKDKNHNFKENTKFSNVVSLYYLDVDLRNILIKFINRIEINFRTKIVYYVSNSNKNSPVWFIDSKVLKEDFIKNIDKHYTEDFKNNNKQIKLHHLKYINDKYAPAWKTIELFTFGAILKIYKSLVDENLQKRISEIYGIRNISKFINFMETIVFIRNQCAHTSVLFDLKTPRGISVFPDIKFNDRFSIDSCIKIIYFILEKISIERRNEMEKNINEIFNNYKNNTDIKRIIETKTCYVYK